MRTRQHRTDRDQSVSIPDHMTAFVLTGHGDLDQLRLMHDVPVPVPSPHEVLVKVGACGLNNTDVNTRSGWYSRTVTEATTGGAYESVGEEDPAWGGSPVSFPRIQGADAVGRIVAVGSDVDPGRIGERIITDNWLRDWDDPMNRDKIGYFGSECDGGFAQFVTLDHRNAVAIDSSLSEAELATFSCSYSTAEGMLERAGVGSGDVVLVTGASGGVGSALVQLAKRRKACVVALASESKHDQIKALAADVVLPRHPDNLATSLQQTIGKPCVSVVADVVGGSAFADVLAVLERGGRYTCSGAIAGAMVELDLRTLYLRDLTFTGSTVLPLDVFPNLVRYIERGDIKPVLAATYPLAELKQAQQAFIEKQHIGNIVVTVQ